jgi:hypothetical protein
MFLVDDILLFPVKGIYWIVHEVHNAAQQELAGEKDAITVRLSELYMMLETGQLAEEEFTAMEKELLDRLDAISEPGAMVVSDDTPGEDDEDDEEAGWRIAGEALSDDGEVQ